ncbi:MAG TPA: hypothetical protein VGK73_31685 [Polyangiaceae bacterium]
MPDWLSSLLAHLSPEGAAGGAFAAILAVLRVVGAVLEGRNKRALLAAEKATKPVTDEVTRKVPALPDSAPDDAPEALIDFWRQRATRALAQLDVERHAHHEAAKLADARERALVAKSRELQADLDAVRGDLVVAQRRANVAEAAGLELRRQWREAQGLDSDSPPANPLSASARTVPPKSR